MIKSNSKKAIENIRKYVIDNYTPESYGDDAASKKTFEEIAVFILDTAFNEKDYMVGHAAPFQIFDDWCRGLPSLFDTCYFYNRSAKKDLGDILEETETERDKYSESQAEDNLTRLIFRELYKIYRY